MYSNMGVDMVLVLLSTFSHSDFFYILHIMDKITKYTVNCDILTGQIVE